MVVVMGEGFSFLFFFLRGWGRTKMYKRQKFPFHFTFEFVLSKEKQKVNMRFIPFSPIVLVILLASCASPKVNPEHSQTSRVQIRT